MLPLDDDEVAGSGGRAESSAPSTSEVDLNRKVKIRMRARVYLTVTERKLTGYPAGLLHVPVHKFAQNAQTHPSNFSVVASIVSVSGKHQVCGETVTP